MGCVEQPWGPRRLFCRVTEEPQKTRKTLPRKALLRAMVKWLAAGVVALWLLGALMLVAAKWIDPPTTAVHMERRLEAWVHGKPYHERYKFIPLREISPDLQHAVIAAEDARFYTHHGFDWQAIEIDAEGDIRIVTNRRETGDVTEYRFKEHEKRIDNHIPSTDPILFYEIEMI